MRIARQSLWALALICATATAAPDLSGVWLLKSERAMLKTEDGAVPPLTAQAQAIYEQHRASAARGDRSFDETIYCLPPGLPRLMLIKKPFEILQRDKVVYFIHQDNRMPRRAYLNEQLPANPEPFYLGHSVAHWDDATLVVESSGFRTGTLLDDAGLPHSEALRLTESYRLGANGKTLHARFIIDDPQSYTRSWSTTAEYDRLPDHEIPEEVCAEKLESTHPKKRK